MDSLRNSSKELHPEVLPISREEIDTKKPKLTLPFYTKYEYTALLGSRAQQLAEGAKPLISLDGMVLSDPRFVWKVAEREILEQKLPYIIHRRLPNGKSEYWSATELSVIW
jgi:DNA-directed RNA polymerase I, II, and III subunit RPABC2